MYQKLRLSVITVLVAASLFGCNVPTGWVESSSQNQVKTSLSDPSITIKSLETSIASKDYVKIRSLLTDSYKDKFMNEYFKSVIPLEDKFTNLTQTSSTVSSSIFDANFYLKYAYGSGSSIIDIPVIIYLENNDSGNWYINKIEVNPLNNPIAPVYKKVEDLYNTIQKDTLADSELNLSPNYEVRISENNQSSTFNSTTGTPNKWKSQIQDWLYNHPFSNDRIIYSEKTTHGYTAYVITFEDGKELYIGYEDSTGKILKIFASENTIDLT